MLNRVALIGDNSVEYIDILLDIWNSNDCAVIIDPQTPEEVVLTMMREASIRTCYIETKYFEKMSLEYSEITIEFIPYNKNAPYAQLLPQRIYQKYQSNYSRNEALVIYSSGTTGTSKGVILSHYAISTNADAIIQYMRPTLNDCIYIIKSLSHSSTVTGELLVALKTRTPLLVAPIVVPPRVVLNNITQYSISIIGVNPLLLNMLAKEAKKSNYNLSTLQKIYVSGSILNDDVYTFAHSVFIKQKIYNVYGLTEAAPRVSAQRESCCVNNSVGKAVDGVSIIIVDDNGNIVEKNKKGIIHIISPSLFSGYISGNSKHQSLYSGWLNTGDVGFFDNDNELHVVGRLDDMINICGHKIYPYDIEKRIQSLTKANECVVTAVEYQETEILCCVYSLEDKHSLNIINVIASLNKVLLKYEIPTVFLKMDCIPRNSNGKISSSLIKNHIIQSLERNKNNERNKN